MAGWLQGERIRPPLVTAPAIPAQRPAHPGVQNVVRDIWRLFGTELLWISIPALLAVAFALSRLSRAPGSGPNNVKIGARALLVVMGLAAGAMLFSPVSKTVAANAVDLDVFRTLHASFTSRLMFSQMVGNLLLLCWLGFLLPIAFRKIKPAMSVLICCGVSVVIEAVQYVIAVGRVSSASDVLFNTIGAAGGALAATLIGRLLPGKHPARTSLDGRMTVDGGPRPAGPVGDDDHVTKVAL
jgi:hypothetical protein